MTRFILLLLLPTWLNAQSTIKGSVVEIQTQKEVPLYGVNIYFAHTNNYTITDESGQFSIASPDSFPALLKASLVGYNPDSIWIHSSEEAVHLTLKTITTLKTAEVVGKTKKTSVSYLNPIHTEVMRKGELLKAACCNLSESFNSNASVDVAFTDAVSGAKKIQLLGLDGKYSQLMLENVPLVRGLSSAYGLSYIPGTWIESIYITKGAGSVANGYESISGLINLDLIKPETAKERLFVNVYANQRNRYEGNIHLMKKINPTLGTILFLHSNNMLMKVDQNKDGFLDMPLIQQYNAFNRWHWRKGERVEGQIGIKALSEERISGQKHFDAKKDYLTLNAYGIGIKTKQAEIFNKTGILFPDAPYKSIGTIISARIHDQHSYFGIKKYNGIQRNLYANFIYNSIVGNTNHKYKVGASYVLDDYREALNDSGFSRTESVPGIFAEYAYDYMGKLNLVIGNRIDFHNLYGTKMSPRIHFKYVIKEKTTLRLSAGRGFRTANIFVENAAVLASSRSIIVKEKLLPEQAWNYGGSITRNFRLGKREAAISVDFFHTNFQHQVVSDMEDVRQIAFYNLKGRSFSNSLQADINAELLENWDIRLAYKHYDVFTTYGDQLLQKPLTYTDRILFNTGYSTHHDIWRFDLTVNWLGKCRIPSTAGNPSAYQLPTRSQPYYLVNAQITKKFKWFDVYLGSENLLRYLQKTPVLSAEQPFGLYFDASLIYAPIEGRIIYLGIRYSIE